MAMLATRRDVHVVYTDLSAGLAESREAVSAHLNRGLRRTPVTAAGM